MRQPRVQLGAHEDGVAVLAMVAEELHVAELGPDRHLEDLAAQQSTSYSCHRKSFCHSVPPWIRGTPLPPTPSWRCTSCSSHSRCWARSSCSGSAGSSGSTS